MHPVEITRGDSPVILGQPHGGTRLPAGVAERLNATGRELADTDWHIGRLYDGLLPGATIVRATFHRYLIDANRDPAGTSLYPGQNTTALCPTTDFDGRPIWVEGGEPDIDEIATRRDAFHAPYHTALEAEVRRVKARHGVAVVFDCHSIRSEIPFLFPGMLPVFNIGTNGGETCSAAMTEAVLAVCDGSGFSTVLNGRFRGGWTTRHYGQPGEGVHAIQIEIAQRAYLSAESYPWAFDAGRAGELRAVLAPILAAIDRLARSGALTV